MQLLLAFSLIVMSITGHPQPQGQRARTVAVDGFVGYPQMNHDWCWAACIQSLFRAKGLNIGQADIVKAAYGEVVDRSAPGFEGTLALLNRIIVDVKGEGWRINAYARPTPPDPAWLYAELANNEAIMVWFRIPRADHAIVLVGGTYAVDKAGNFASWKSLTGYDPLFDKNLPIPFANLRRYVYGTFYVRISRLRE